MTHVKHRSNQFKRNAMAAKGMRIYFSVLVIILTALVVQFRAVTQSASVTKIGNDPVTLLIREMEGLKDIIPRGTVVGYLSNVEAKSFRLGALVRPEAFYITQYALAPVIVDYSAEHSFLVGYFHPRLEFELISKSLSVITDFDNGVVLLRGE